MSAIAAPVLRGAAYAQILYSFAPALVPEPASINQKFRNDEGRAVADKVPATEARSNKSAQAL